MFKARKFKRRPDWKSSHKDYFIFNYVILVSLLSIILFLHGFFPTNYIQEEIATRKDIPKFVERTRIKTEEVYRPVVKKVIIMVIDALRWDFVAGINSSKAMPITTSLLRSSAGCLYKTRVTPPTVTMPRIKAMTTGSVPNFIEVVLNLGANEVAGDNIIWQIKNRGHKIVFYGDDTWLKLFPHSFYRYEGTSSFYVNDFKEVDYNVTRNVAVELNEKDWTIMILHYLGLDHIGHVAGPSSHLIKPKLLEMDEIIGTIESYVSDWSNKREPTLFLVCGDHGMKDSGGHGGATLEETLVPLLAFGKPCTNKQSPNQEIAQIDIAPTLSVLLGTPIPSTNLGTVILELMSDFSLSHKLFALYYNAEQLFLHYQKVSGHQYTKAYKSYQDAVKLHSAWLNTHSHPNEMVHDIVLMYESAIVEMKNTLTSNLLKYDVHTMTLATVFMVQILYISISIEKSTSISYRYFFTVFFASYIFWMFLNQLFDSEAKAVFFTQNVDLHSVLVSIPVIGIAVLNCYLCATRTLAINKFQFELTDLTSLQNLLIMGTLLHTVSLTGSSFVEEEHQIWYFYWITIIAFFTYDVFRKNFNGKSGKFPMLLLSLMIVHRVLRKLNSTGDKYAHLPDISGWLLNQNSTFAMTFILITGLVMLVLLDYHYDEVEHRPIILTLDGFIATLVYLRHAVTDAVFKPDFYFDSRGIIEIRYFWAFMACYVIHSVYRLRVTMRHHKHKFLPLSLFLILKKWVIISCILQRPYNVILLPVQLMSGAMICDLTRNEKNFGLKLYLYLWSSYAFYFYQGNSNSLATVDVAAGYVGLESYRPLITGIFLSIHTYSAHIIGFLMYLCDHALQNPLSTSETMLSLCKKYTFWRLVPLTFYTVVASFQRYHLFVWTVFSPKLLYEAMHCLVLSSVMLLLQLDFLLYDRIKAQKKDF